MSKIVYQPSITPTTYEDFLKWCETRQSMSTTTLVALLGITLGPLIINSSTNNW